MRCNKIIRLTALTLALSIFLNICDFSLFNTLFPKTEVSAATALTTQRIQSYWADRRGELSLDNSNKPTAGFWKDTSGISTYWIDTSVHTSVEGLSNDVATAIKKADDGSIHKVSGSSVADNAFVYNATPIEPSDTVYYTVEKSEEENTLKGYYRKYYVSTANQFQWVLYKSEKVTDADIKAYYPDDTFIASDKLSKISIELLCDIDLGGSNGQNWKGYSDNDIILEIKGNNFDIYNGYFISDRYFFNNAANKFSITDLDFCNMYIGRNYGIFGNSTARTYFENVNFYDSVAVGGSSTAICFGNSYNYAYFKNCMMKNCYVYGSGGHCSTFGSYNGKRAFVGIGEKTTYIGDTNPDSTVNSYYTKNVPDIGVAEIAWSGKKAVFDENEYTMTPNYPSIYENCMSIDSEVYDSNANHSGTFVSCMQSCIIFKNCFTNSTIYANQLAGCFIGCCIGSSDGFYYEVEGEKSLVSAYFENCYASGLVEGASNEGGFIGGVFTDQRSYNTTVGEGATPYRGKCVFKNCYSTSSTGMQYSASQKIGGFVGGISGNGFAADENDKAHMFINCYSAGEVGGIETDTSILPTNITTTGGFIGENINQTFTNASISFKERINPVIINSYYDKQTTAMRERSIGSSENNIDLSSSIDGLKGVYTLHSDTKNVAGLADTVRFDDSNWSYIDGYYPELTAFMGENAKKNFGDKAEVAELYSRASVSTVHLDHWDNIMDNSGNIIHTTDTTVYDTVRDISSKFEFSSGGNTNASNLGWQLNEEKNKQSKFPIHMGEKTYADEPSEEYGFDIEFNYMDRQGNSQEVTQHYDPEILNIMADSGANGDYVFKCFEFSAGKQFVKVTTCGDSDYSSWKAAQDEYNDYLIKLDEFTLTRAKYVKLLGKEGSTLSDEDIRAEINQRLNNELKINDQTPDEYKIRERLLEVQRLTHQLLSDNNIERVDAAKKLNTMFGLGYSEFTEENITLIYADTSKFIQYNIYPFVEPAQVSMPSDFSSYVKGSYGTRTLRLVPQSYLYPGDMISINVEADEVTGEVTNNVIQSIGTDDAIYTNAIDHTIGVAYSSTQGYPGAVTTRLGNDEIYRSQQLVQNTSSTYNKNTGEFTLGNEFAIYDVFPSAKADDIKGENINIESGFTGLVEQKLIGNFSLDPVGQTKVDVYTTKSISSNEGTVSLLERNEKIDMSNPTNLDKWTGQTPFQVSDNGYYYMVYYWRMADGRYLEENRLVKITSNKFTVKMRTGVANAEEDSFVYITDEAGNKDIHYTSIDCDTLNLDEEFNENQHIQRHYFPSDYYHYRKGNGYNTWEEFAALNYDDDYGDHLHYNEGDYWIKSKTTTTGDNEVCVAWRKSTDYALVKLMVEVKINNNWIPMAITGTMDQDTNIEEEAPAFYYTYESYDVVENPQTKRYSVITTENVVKTFAVSNAIESQNTEDDTENKLVAGGGSVRYINFKFFDESANNSSIEFNDDIRVTALFREVSANVVATESVLIDDGKDEMELVNNNGEYISLSEAEEYRSVDNTDLDDVDKKAVLFGDRLIYRKKVQNIGQYNANNVFLVQKVPDGLTVDTSSIKLYKQDREINSFGEDTFNQLVEVPLTEHSENNIDDRPDFTVELNEYYYDAQNREIIYKLNPVNMATDYYLSFEATTPDDYKTIEQSYNTEADYYYAFINGDVKLGTSSQIGSNNENYAGLANFNITSNQQNSDNGEITYTIIINKQAYENLVIRNMYNEIPEGYEIVSITPTYPEGAKEHFKLTQEDGAFYINATNGYTVNNNTEEMKIEFTIKPILGAEQSERLINNFSLTYTPVGGSTADANINTARLVSDVTNSVTSEARWLYLNVEKTIDNEDTDQSFLFKVMNFTKNNDPDKYIFTDIICDEKVNDSNVEYYKGNQIIQIGERGCYDVTETSWSDTDYDYSYNAKYSAIDINEVSDNTFTNSDIIIQSSTDHSFYLPRAIYSSTAFPLWAVEQISEDGTASPNYPTISCYNKESEYAWLSAQSSVENSFSFSDISTLQSRAATQVPLVKDEPVSSQGVMIVEGLVLKKEEEE